MSSSLMHALIAATFAASIAVLVVAALRKPLRRMGGSGSAYWLWLLVPASALAVFVPAPAHEQGALPASFTELLSKAVVTVSTGASSTSYMKIALATWLLGGCVFASLMLVRHLAFVRSLGRMRIGPEGVLCSDYVAGPMVLGAWRARVIVPADFAARYTPEERALMLAHEQAHLERGDALINVIAASWLCVFWFNPLMYWAVGRLHFDQELACDARVISRRAAGRKFYAGALLKAQLPLDSAWRTPIGCHWQSSHPLKERIAVLKYPAPGSGRRVAAVAVSIALCFSSIYAVTIVSGQTNTTARSPATSGPAAADWTAKFIDLECQNGNIRDVLLEIARKTGQKMVFSEPARQKLGQPKQTVTLHFLDIPAGAALEVLAKSDGLLIRHSADVIFVDVQHP